LGHKQEIPGSGQWIETSVETAPAEMIGDWIQNKSILTFVFWSPQMNRNNQVYSHKEIQNLASFIKVPDLDKIKA
jgi:hypothetical protein